MKEISTNVCRIINEFEIFMSKINILEYSKTIFLHKNMLFEQSRFLKLQMI